jgi:hypothetical protein
MATVCIHIRLICTISFYFGDFSLQSVMPCVACDTKRFSWPVYVTTARRVAGCPAAVLVVLCPDPAEAAKCRQIVRTGHPGIDLASEPGARGVLDAIASAEVSEADRLRMTTIILKLAVRCEAPCSITHKWVGIGGCFPGLDGLPGSVR